MRGKRLHWYDYSIGIAPLALLIWQYLALWATDVHQGGHQTSELKEAVIQLILTFKYWVPIALVAINLFAFLTKQSRDSASKKTMQRFLLFLHETFFPHETGGPDPQHRVSLFVPKQLMWKWKFIPYYSRETFLVLYARSGLYPKSKVKWNGSQSEMGHFDGIVGRAWATKIFVDIANLPAYNACSAEEQQAYLLSTYITVEKLKKLNVKSQSYQALLIQNRSGEKIGVLMMESELPQGLSILTPAKWYEVANNLQCLLLS